MPNWEKLARAETHPERLAILEALEGSQEPLSAVDLAPRIGSYSGKIAWHLAKLVDGDLIELVCTKQGRGNAEKFYRAVRS